jgi:hypothetical protein
MQQINVTLPVAGADYVGPLPAELQGSVDFAGGVLAVSEICQAQWRKDPDRSHTLGWVGSQSQTPLAPVFSRRHPGGLPLQGPEAGAGEVITASVADDLEHFLALAFCLRIASAYVPIAKFLVAGNPAENRRPAGHPGIATDGTKAFALDQPVADRPGDLGVIIGWTAALVLPQLHGSWAGNPSAPAGV